MSIENSKDTTQMLADIKKRMDADNPSIRSNIQLLNRFRIKFPDHQLENAYGYVFFTRPDLNILDDTGKILDDVLKRPEFHDLLKTDADLFTQLKANHGGAFINPLFGAIESFEVSDEVMKTRDTNETANDWKVVYGHKTSESLSAGTFNVSYSDDRNLTIFKTHNLWINYMKLISAGHLKPSDKNRFKRILDYASSVYYFLTSEDGETIIFFTKYIGVFPTNKPGSAFSWNKNDFKQLNYSIQYQYSFKVPDMDPLIIKDFNAVAGKGLAYTPIYNKTDDLPANTWARTAFIQEVNNQRKLRFL